MNVYKKQSDGSYKTETIGEYQKQAYESLWEIHVEKLFHYLAQSSKSITT